MKFKQFVIDDEHQGLPVETYMRQVLGYSGRQIQKLTRKKGILLNGRPAFLQRKVLTGDRLQVLVLEDRSYGVLPEPGEIEVLYEDRDIVIVNKPAGMLVHPAGRTTCGTLANYLAYYFQQAGMVHTIRPLHRLDRETSGCVLFAKNSPTQTALERELREGRIRRTYLALVKGIIDPQEGKIDAPIGIHPRFANRRIVSSEGEPAVTYYRVLEKFSEACLVELNLETGRTHQIRVHLAHIGHPVIGDGMYGKRDDSISRQALHAVEIALVHPVTKQELSVKAPIPEDIEKAICSFTQKE